MRKALAVSEKPLKTRPMVPNSAPRPLELRSSSTKPVSAMVPSDSRFSSAVRLRSRKPLPPGAGPPSAVPPAAQSQPIQDRGMAMHDQPVQGLPPELRPQHMAQPGQDRGLPMHYQAKGPRFSAETASQSPELSREIVTCCIHEEELPSMPLRPVSTGLSGLMQTFR